MRPALSDSRPMAMVPYVALRYLRSTRRDAFISFLSAVAAGGIALGVAALIIALAALSGFQRALRQEILARTPELEVALPPGTEPGPVALALAGEEGVGEVSLLLRGNGWLRAAGRVLPAELVGYQGEPPRSFPGASREATGLLLGDSLVETWGLDEGEIVEIASVRPMLTPFGPQPRVVRLPLVGTFTTGRTEQQARAALPLAEAEKLLAGEGYRLQLFFGDLELAVRRAPRLASLLPEGAKLETWQDLNRGLFFALRLEKGLMFVAVFLIVVVASLALVSDLNLIIAAKRSEVGMLGAMGARRQSLRGVFLWLGGMLAGLGIALGAAVGVAGSLVMDRFRLLRLPERVYFLDYVPFRLQPLDLVVVIGATLALTLICAALAAGRAAALRPVEALRR